MSRAGANFWFATPYWADYPGRWTFPAAAPSVLVKLMRCRIRSQNHLEEVRGNVSPTDDLFPQVVMRISTVTGPKWAVA